MRIYMTGFMGAGKSKVGRLLAERLGVPFVDLDTEIEAVATMPIHEIFAKQGEDIFRDLEHRILQATEAQEHAVVATGGGTLTFPRNLAEIRRLGTSVWLDPSFATLVARLGPESRKKRPLFQDEAQAETLYQQRLDAYRQADLHIQVEADETAAQVAARIALRLSGVPTST